MLKGLPGVVWRTGGWREGKGKQGWECSSGDQGWEPPAAEPLRDQPGWGLLGRGTLLAFWAQQGASPVPACGIVCAALARGFGV